MYRLKSIMNYNGTYRLEDELRKLIGWRCSITSMCLKDMCVYIIFWSDSDDEDAFITTSPVREVMGVAGKTDLTIKTQNTIYDLELIREEK